MTPLLRTTTRSLLISFAALGAAGLTCQAAAQEDEPQPREPEQRVIEDQAEQAIRELFKDFDLQLEDLDDPDNRLREQRERLEALQRRILIQRRERQVNPELFEQQIAAQPDTIAAEPLVSPWSERSRDEAVDALDDPSFEVRESAEDYLLTDDTLGRAALAALLQQANSPEQRHRLLRLAEHHVLRELRERDFGNAAEPGPFAEGRPAPRVAPQPPRQAAAIGYSYEPVLANENPHLPRAGVAVIATMPGFPGHAHLKRGDIIVEIDGRSLSNGHQHHDITAWVRWRISAHRAGDTIRFTVLRDGKPIALSMVCAEAAALNAMYTTDAFEAAARKAEYERGWQDARRALTQGLPEPTLLTPAP